MSSSQKAQEDYRIRDFGDRSPIGIEDSTIRSFLLIECGETTMEKKDARHAQLVNLNN